ncbi:glycosyltransferase [Paenibacillus filicis]|uniref:Glycosyltransferase n=1 Tax=Paenibacillus gyeongsangnamensis TaxID=3388067 RepID=A0ABT4Q495_9BACL|nr:glycosyltransferase [Paenibacillus filicis]MCZ8511683.1 glycosyltransferase [Paenibacillus filicis]
MISVIIPTYNRYLELGELLECLDKQHERRFEVIIVNDNGQRIDDVIQPYRDCLDIRTIHLEQNYKHIYARNRGVAEARGDYILLCDDDDLLPKIMR